MKILVVEDDPVICDALCELVAHWGHVADAAGDGCLAWEMLQAQVYDLLLLDLNLPGMDGLTLCHRLRQSSVHQPLVLMLTARDGISDNIQGLDHGADDYLVKPFDPLLLRARIQALLRRASRPLQDGWQWGPLQVLSDGRSALFAGQDLRLTPKEHLILEELLRAAGRACSKEQLLQAAWSWADSPGDESVKTHVKNLRAKLTSCGAPVDLVETVYGVGFRMNSNYAG